MVICIYYKQIITSFINIIEIFQRSSCYFLQIFAQYKFEWFQRLISVQPVSSFWVLFLLQVSWMCILADSSHGPGHSSDLQESSSISISRDITEQHFNMRALRWRHPGWEQCNNEHLILLNEHICSSQWFLLMTTKHKEIKNVQPQLNAGGHPPPAADLTGWHRKVQRYVVISAGRADTHIKKCAATTQNV